MYTKEMVEKWRRKKLETRERNEWDINEEAFRYVRRCQFLQPFWI